MDKLTGEDHALIKAMKLLKIDPMADVDLAWVAREFIRAQHRLPAGWRGIRQPDGALRYIHDVLKVDTLENPIAPRYRVLIQYLQHCKKKNQNIDELTILELLDPLENPQDLKAMILYMGIDPYHELHLAWIAKLALLEALPEGWAEVTDTSGATVYTDLRTGRSQPNHPLDLYFKALLDRERAKPPPPFSILPEAYAFPPTRYRDDTGPDGKPRRPTKIPGQGMWVDLYDVYGRRYYYHVLTDEITTNVEQFKPEYAIKIIQKFWRGYKLRRAVLQMKRGVNTVAMLYRNFRYRKMVYAMRGKKDTSVFVIQHFWRNLRVQVEASKEVFVRIGYLGLKRPIRATAVKAVSGLLESGRTFRGVRRSCIMIQRCFRALRARRRGLPAPSAVDMIQHLKRHWNYPTYGR